METRNKDFLHIESAFKDFLLLLSVIYNDKQKIHPQDKEELNENMAFFYVKKIGYENGNFSFCKVKSISSLFKLSMCFDEIGDVYFSSGDYIFYVLHEAPLLSKPTLFKIFTCLYFTAESFGLDFKLRDLIHEKYKEIKGVQHAR